MQITSRLIKPDDAQTLIDLLQGIREFKIGPNEAKRKIALMSGMDSYPALYILDGKPVGYACFLFENKLWGDVGRIEDVVVSTNFRKQGICRHIIDDLLKLAQLKGCYKVLLTCSDELAPMYEKFGFKRWQGIMRYDF